MTANWPKERCAKLRAFWNQGLVTRLIAEALGVSKNAVIGKVRRLHLPPRSSPIQLPLGSGTKPKRKRSTERRQGRPTCPAVTLHILGQQGLEMAVNNVLGQTELMEVFQHQTLAPKPSESRGSCCWPIGDPGTPGFRFCEATAVLGKPYCREHCHVAYVQLSIVERAADIKVRIAALNAKK